MTDEPLPVSVQVPVAYCMTCGNMHPAIHHACCANAWASRADLEQEVEQLESKLATAEALMPDVLILLDAMAKHQRDEYARGIAADLRRGGWGDPARIPSTQPSEGE